MEVILYSKECNWYTRCCPLNGGVCYRECPLREVILYMYMYTYFREGSVYCSTCTVSNDGLNTLHMRSVSTD